MTPGPGTFGEAALKHKTGYFCVAMSEAHAAALENRFRKAALRYMCEEGVPLYDARCAAAFKTGGGDPKPPVPKPTPPAPKPKPPAPKLGPKPKAGGKPKPKPTKPDDDFESDTASQARKRAKTDGHEGGGEGKEDASPWDLTSEEDA